MIDYGAFHAKGLVPRTQTPGEEYRTRWVDPKAPALLAFPLTTFALDDGVYVHTENGRARVVQVPPGTPQARRHLLGMMAFMDEWLRKDVSKEDYVPFQHWTAKVERRMSATGMQWRIIIPLALGGPGRSRRDHWEWNATKGQWGVKRG